MARYFLHLRDGTDELLDREGKEFATTEQLREHVLFSARDLMAGDIRNGLLDMRPRIEAENEGGQIVYSLNFTDAVNIISGEGCA